MAMSLPLKKFGSCRVFLTIFDSFGNLHRLRDLTLETILTETRHGLVFRRHADDEGPLPAQHAGHLLRRASDRKSPSRYGLEGVRCRTQKGVPDPSQANEGADQAAQPGVQETEGQAARDQM